MIDMHLMDRREFLTVAGGVPLSFALRGVGAWTPVGDARSLVVLELEGGNDGLNTVIPVDDEAYRKARPQLGAVRRGAHELGDGTSLHPSLAQLSRLVAEGLATVVHGVGYPSADRSHFRSRDIWHVADPEHRRVTAKTTGWLGRTARAIADAASGAPAAAIGSLEVPLALRAPGVTVPSLRSVADFQWLAADRSGPLPPDAGARAVVAMPQDDATELRRFVAERARNAVRMADELSAAIARYRPATNYPESSLGRSLQLVAQLVISGFGTRLLHVPFGGFDTHARQLPTHAALLRQLDEAVSAFVADLRAHRVDDRVALFVHSEFGRRVAENASQGTDHGAAGPAFVVGGGTVGGTRGTRPDLGRLDDGDVAMTMDFRRLYTDTLRWLDVDPVAVLGGAFEPAGIFRA